MYTLYVVRQLDKGAFSSIGKRFALRSCGAEISFRIIHLEDIILASGATQSGDEVYIQASAGKQSATHEQRP